MRVLHQYENGNYYVKFFNNGTKIRFLKDGENEFQSEFPENIDVKISNRCSLGCEFCHEHSCKNGKVTPGLEDGHYRLQFVDTDTEKKLRLINIDNENLNNFIDTLHPGTEVAIGGGALSELKGGFWNFLMMIRNKRCIVNCTVNGQELLNDEFYSHLFKRLIIYYKDRSKFDLFMRNHPEIDEATPGLTNSGLISGLGISYNSNPKVKERMLALKKCFPDSVVVHTIYGITEIQDYMWLIKNNFKILVLGYKNFRRGAKYLKSYENTIEINQKEFNKHLSYILHNCKRISFDCLAVEQLMLYKKVDPEIWETHYMGDDGKFTMYVDLVNGTFATNSTTPEEERLQCSDYNFSVPLMFKEIKNKNL